MEHPHTRLVVIVVGGESDPATDEDAEALVWMIKERTGLKAFALNEKPVVNRIIYKLLGIPGF